jgi:large subunit ribosomal protein L31
MKPEIHPEYMVARVKCTCGNEFATRATRAEYHLEICSQCHPFYTGRQKLVDTGGRVERFQRRAAKGRLSSAGSARGRRGAAAAGATDGTGGRSADATDGSAGQATDAPDRAVEQATDAPESAAERPTGSASAAQATSAE